MKLSHVVFSVSLAVTTIGCGSDSATPDGGPVTGEHYKYVMSNMTIPSNASQTQSLGMDIDSAFGGDAGIDNQLGSVLSALANMGFDNQTTISDSVKDGNITILMDLQTSSFTAASSAGVAISLGENPMPAPCTDPNDATTCGQHLMGTGSFTVANTPGSLNGSITGGKFTGGPGTIQVQIALQAGSPITLNLIAAKAELTGITADGIMTGKIAGAVPKSDVDGTIIPTVAAQLDATIGRDCTRMEPNCGCMENSTGASLVSGFDTDHNCSITSPELAANPLVMGLLVSDVEIEGTEAISLGVGMTAVKASF